MTQVQTIERQCQEVLENFQHKAFPQWRGLPSSCSLSALPQNWPVIDEGTMYESLGSKHIETEYRHYSIPSYNHPARIFSRQHYILQIDMEDPLSARTASPLLKQLGNPEAKLDTSYGFAEVVQGEWFYGRHGIALIYFAEDDHIEALSVFVPSTLETYIEQLRIKRGARPIPRPVSRRPVS